MMEIMLDKQKTLTEIGLRIRQLREERGLSMVDLADKLDMEYNSVVRIETGKTNFTIGTLVRVANGLEIPIVDLFK